MVPGDEGAFTELYGRHYPDVLAYARRRVDEQTARDVAADTFLVAWRRAAELPADQPLPWLYAVARNTLANAMRSRARQEALGVRIVAAAAGDATVQPDHADAAVRSAQVAAALRLLSPRDQEALQLVAWEDLNLATAAQVVGCSPATFAVRLHRARRRLGRLLSESGTSHTLHTEMT